MVIICSTKVFPRKLCFGPFKSHTIREKGGPSAQTLCSEVPFQMMVWLWKGNSQQGFLKTYLEVYLGLLGAKRRYKNKQQ